DTQPPKYQTLIGNSKAHKESFLLLHFHFYDNLKNIMGRAPGWLIRQNIQLLIPGSRVQAPCWVWRLLKNKGISKVAAGFKCHPPIHARAVHYRCFFFLYPTLNVLGRYGECSICFVLPSKLV
ncbi:unnamed protein product, partial [Gulo gulo]